MLHTLQSKIGLSLLHMSCKDLSKNIFVNFVAIWHLILLILIDCLSFVEYQVFLYKESNFGTLLTTRKGNILKSFNKFVIIFDGVLHF